MPTIDKNLKGLLIDDHGLFRHALKSSLHQHLNSEIEDFENGLSAFARVIEASRNNHDLDFVVTDINHANMNGLEFIEKIRGLSDKKLYYNGLRIKHIPIIILSLMNDSRIKEAVDKISKNIVYLTKDDSVENVLKGIVKSMAQYRKSVVEEFTNNGYAIHFENGKYRICNHFNLLPHIKTKYFAGMSDDASRALTRAIMIHNRSAIGKISIGMFEELLNDDKSAERDFHDFFRLFPEFLLEGNYDILHSEKSFQQGNKVYRMDIIAQPRGQREEESQWAIVELKKHNEKILTDKKYHANFSKSVYNAITQLKNYQVFFNDSANAPEIKKKLNGVVPNPKLSLIIGRTTKDKQNLFKQMKSQFPEITITTYDEIINFRKIQVQYMESLGF